MDVIARWAASVESGEFDLSLLDPNAVVWHSHDGVEMTVDQIRASISATKEAVADLSATNMRTRRHNRGAVLEYDVCLTSKDGSVSNNPASAIITVEGDRITRIDEYILNDSGTDRELSQWVVGKPPIAEAHDRMMADIVRLGLERNVVELEIYGFTVLPPEIVGEPELAERTRRAILRIAEERTGISSAPNNGGGYQTMQAPLGRGFFLNNLLFEDRVFEETLLNEPALALMTYLLGEQCILNQQSLMVKGQGGQGLSLHADHMGTPEPFPHVPSFANVTWIFSDYTKANGSLAVVRGSHLLCRQPTPAENEDKSLWHPVEAPAGSMIIWHGNLWHGAFPRQTPGVRISLSNFFCRWGVLPQDQIRARVTKEMLDRNPRRFATLVGLGYPSYSRDDGLNNEYRHSPFDGNRFTVNPWSW